MEKIVIEGLVFHHGDYISAELRSATPRNEEKYDGYKEDHPDWQWEAADDDEEDEDDDGSSWIKVNGRLSITCREGEGFKVHICQNFADGCSGAKEKFGYRCSWVASVSADGELISEDSRNIFHRHDDSSKSKPSVPRGYDDDDPMPEDWVPTEIDLITI